MVIRRSLLYARTLRYLRARQVVAQVSRRLIPRRAVTLVPEFDSFRGLTPLRPFVVPAVPDMPSGSIAFLNQSRAFGSKSPDWFAADMPKLWRYNLHYFDYLHWPSYSVADKTALVDDWIVHVAQDKGDAWEPYPLSLRVANWLKFLAGLPPGALPRSWLDSLAVQLASLRGDVEHHLLANHLLKNAKALVLGGLAFDGPAAADWLKRGMDILRTETDEQVLPDGGHFERSPMYHCIVLEDYLDLLNVLVAHPGQVPVQDVGRIVAAARRATDFLRTILGGDGQFPLFNDAAYGIAAPTATLIDYAEAVLASCKKGGVQGHIDAAKLPMRVCLPESGYFGYRHGGDSLILDCGLIGPDYQPGHAHCDMLSFELCVGGHRVVVDSGVHDYEVGPQRDYDRSTGAHNTVMVDGVEQSETWGAFRVARRARPLFAELTEWSDGELRFRGAHDGYHRIRGRVGHEREFVIQQAGRWEIRDRLTGRGEHRVQSFVHFHPSCEVRSLSANVWRISLSDGICLRISSYGGSVRLADGWYSPEFGKRMQNKVLVIEMNGSLPMECGYVLERIPREDA